MTQDSLGGNSKTCIIANVHPGSFCFGETLSTLQFAQRAKMIVNKAHVNENSEGDIRSLQVGVRVRKGVDLASFFKVHRTFTYYRFVVLFRRFKSSLTPKTEMFHTRYFLLI